MDEKANAVPTKERIIFAALDLFSENGYDGTSIDQIGAAAGVKGPSIYRHFKGKEDILNALIERMNEYYNSNFGTVSSVKIPDSIEEFENSTMARIRFTIADANVRKIRKLLVKEQFRNMELANMTTHHHVSGIMELYRVLIEGMIRKGLLKDAEADMMSLTLISPITLMIHECDRHPVRTDEIITGIERYLRYFIKTYGTSDAGTNDRR